jgi:hypothetical protein
LGKENPAMSADTNDSEQGEPDRPVTLAVAAPWTDAELAGVNLTTTPKPLTEVKASAVRKAAAERGVPLIEGTNTDGG